MRKSFKFLLIFTVFASVLKAQNDTTLNLKNVSEPNFNQTEAPKIDLPEFQITGMEFISLPSLSKDTVDEDRFFSTSGLIKNKKDLAILQNEKIIKESEILRESISGKVLGSIGSFQNKSLEGWFGKNYNEGGILFHGLFFGLDDKTRNATNDIGKIAVNGNLLLNRISDFKQPIRLRGEIELLKNSYNTFAEKLPSDFNVSKTVLKFGLDNNIEELSILKNLNFNLDAKLNFYNVKNQNNEIVENEFELKGKSFFKIIEVPLKYELDLISPTKIEVFDTTFNYPFYFRNAFTYQNNFADKIYLSAVFQFYNTKGMELESEFNFLPQLEVSYKFNDENNYAIGFSPTINYINYQTLFENNPFLNLSSKYNFEKIPLNIFLKSENKINSNNKISSNIFFKSIKNKTTFIQQNDSAKIWSTLRLTDVNEFGIELLLETKITNKSGLKTKFYFTELYKDDTKKSLPNYSPIKFGTIYEANLIENLLFEAYLFYNSKKWIDLEETKSVNGFFDAGVKSEYQLIEKLKLFGGISNLFNSKIIYWDGYREKGFSLFLGLTYSW